MDRLQPPEPQSALGFVARLAERASRRRFLQWAGVTIAVSAVACDDSSDITPPPGDDGVSLGTGDTAVLNYAYALEQLEAAFYTQVVNSPFGGITAEEQRILTDIRDHEVIHRDFLAAALGNNAIPALTVSFASVDFTSRQSVLETARTFEDLGVAAYNGAGQRLTDANNLLIAGKIVSVEARHASVIRDLLQPLSAAFAGDDVIDAQGLDRALEPSAVLAAADPFITTTIDAGELA